MCKINKIEFETDPFKTLMGQKYKKPSGKQKITFPKYELPPDSKPMTPVYTYVDKETPEYTYGDGKSPIVTYVDGKMKFLGYMYYSQ